MPLDLRDPYLIAQEVGVANRRLALERDVPASVDHFVERLVDALIAADPDDWTGDPHVLLNVQRSAMRALRAATGGDPLQKRRAMRSALEDLRFLFSLLAEDEPISEERAPKEVAQWLATHLDVSHRVLAELIRVHERTFQRWVSGVAPTAPSGANAHRLRTVAQLAAQLRPGLTGTGVIAWFGRPHAALGGAAPAALLDDPAAIPDLRCAARATRGSTAT